MNARHPFEADLALYAGGDLGGWERVSTAFHVRFCERCHERVQAFCLNRQQLSESTPELPAGLNWDRLSAEMTANIRVGLAAGECVAPATRQSESSGWNWKPAVAFASLAMVFAAAWWLNMPLRNVPSFAVAVEDRGPVVEASSEGVEFRENGSAMGVSSSAAQPVATSVSFGGSASARYVDDTGQITITTVYVQ
ncbi:MAG: hypothetical protein ABIR70_01180 [Bryobacteraceae bacterium]